MALHNTARVIVMKTYHLVFHARPIISCYVLARINQQRSRYNHLRKATHSQKDISAIQENLQTERETERRSKGELFVIDKSTGCYAATSRAVKFCDLRRLVRDPDISIDTHVMHGQQSSG
eukprot:scaffold984_cov144-Skeletonema_marinoi.AAC.19